MKLITPKDLEEFIEFSKTQESPENFKCVEAWSENDVKCLLPMADVFLIRGLIGDACTSIVSAILSGFQMGRQYEIRQRELAELEKLEAQTQ